MNEEIKPEYYTNYDLENIVTPVKVDVLCSLLRNAGYPDSETRFLEEGSKNGFDIGYEGSQVHQSTSKNIPFTIGNQTELWNKLMKEVKLGRVAGPYKQIPFNNYMQLPIGLVPKAGGDQTQLIFHLSYDFKCDGLKSLNYHTPRHKCTVKYKDLDSVVRVYLQLCNEILAEQKDREESITKTVTRQQEACSRNKL